MKTIPILIKHNHKNIVGKLILKESKKVKKILQNENIILSPGFIRKKDNPIDIDIVEFSFILSSEYNFELEMEE